MINGWNCIVFVIITVIIVDSVESNVNIYRRCNICKIPCKMPITSIDNFKLYLKKNDAEYHNIENYKYYYTNIDQLNKYIRTDFATKKVELSCDYLTRCQECQINYQNS